MTMTKKIIQYSLGIVVLSMVLVLAPVSANMTAVNQARAAGWWDQAYDGGLKDVGQAYGQNSSSLSDNNDIRLIVVRIIRRILELLGLIFLVLIIFAGFKWMTSGGDEEKVTSAKKLLTNSVIGLVIILVAFSIATFVFNSLQYATTGIQPMTW
jgi:hypothetical protein